MPEQKSAMAGRHPRQQGAALLIFLILLVTAALTYVVTSLTPEAIEAQRNRKTQEALALAREALIGYALKYRDEEAAQGRMDRMYGYLPLPDLGSSRNLNTDPNCKDASNNPLEGCDANTPSGIAYDANGILPTIVGRLPWRTLGIAPLRDGSGECLWLIVSSLHGRKQRSTPPPILPPLNWDTLGQLDIVVANGTAALLSTLATAHDRPVAIVFAPGSPLPGQDRSRSTTDDVSQCGGNYDAGNYLDPFNISALGGFTNYLGGTNSASGSTGDSDPSNDPDTPKGLFVKGKVYSAGGNYLPDTCQGSGCTLAANDFGQAVTSEMLFSAIRKSANFRTDINTMLDRMVSCLRDEIAAGNPPAAPHARIAGADTHACYGQGSVPLGYYPHYKEMVFVAVPAGGANVSVDGVAQPNCAGALLFASQRGAGQQRVTLADKAAYGNYLEGGNLASFTASGNSFAGAGLLDRYMAGGQAKEQDIVKCIPASASLNEVISPALDALGGQLVDYDPGSRTLTLGRQFAISDAQRGSSSGAFFGCSWTPETRSMGSGFRSYFKFQITDTGHGFAFAVIDGSNSANVCGAEAEHLGYSGSNPVTPPIGYPKIGIEIDTSKNTSRDDPVSAPSGQSGHAAMVYWGTESTGSDDNTHGLPTPPDPSPRPAPRNPPREDVATANSGIAYLPGSSIPTDDVHVRIEVSRLSTDDAQHSSAYRVDVWIEKGNTKAAVIAAMRNTARPLATLYPSPDTAVDTHLRDTPTIYDIQGGACSPSSPCPSANQVCGSDNLCYTKGFDTARLGFTTSQSSTTSSKDQLITISDFITTWIP
jgi:type II secretory pathway pseudopilin PulG